MPTSKKDLSYYLTFRYPCELSPTEEGGYFARHPDLDGCATQGDTVEEALANLQVARELWLKAQFETGSHIPEPPNEEPSGRLMLRVPLRLHAQIERRAASFGRSMNRLLNEVLFNYAHGLPYQHGLERQAAAEDRPNRSGETGEDHLLERHLSRSYSFQLIPCDEGGYVAEHPDLPGCAAQGETAEQALAELAVARELWIESRLEEGLPIPEPLPLEHTGILSLRMPPALHYELVRDATRNGVSLNQLLNMVLAEFVGNTAASEKRSPVPVKTSSDPEHEIIQQAVPLLRQELDGSGRQLLSRLGKTREDFLIGVLHLEKRSYKAAFRSFSAAYDGGLNFMDTAVRLFRTMPGRLPMSDLLDRLLELTHAIPRDTPEKNEVHVLLAAWFEGIKGNPVRQERWLRWGREERKRAA